MTAWIVAGSSGEFDTYRGFNQSVWSNKVAAENEVIRLTRLEMVRRKDKKNYPFDRWIFWGIEGPYEIDKAEDIYFDEDGDRE